MRLINTKTLVVEEFFDGHAPKYAILSHRWVDGEVTLQDMQNGSAATKPGYQKILSTCKQALADDLTHAWVDTCCIDKTSSAELSEAINSMYRWYAESTICYAFLSDVTVDEVILGPSEDAFVKSLWFSRGWTLQELLAPSHVTFYSASWKELGTKDSLKVPIAVATLIDISMFEAGANLENYSIARRMSWAARRVTTRKEDMAYCLLGIFNVNMPMLYGEGDRAFIRLQEEIMKDSDDHSLFAWSSDSTEARGLLARSPADFAICAAVDVTHSRWNKEPYAISNLGLRIQLPMIPYSMDTYLAALDCELSGHRLGIFLRMLPRENRYARVMVNGEDLVIFDAKLAAKCTYRYVFVEQRLWGTPLAEERFYGFWMRTLMAPVKSKPKSKKKGRQHSNGKEEFTEVITRGEWNDEDRLFELELGDSGTAGALSIPGMVMGVVKVGFDKTFNPRLQYGGSLFSPEIGNLDVYSDEGRLHPSWMDAPARSMYLHRGTRLGRFVKDDNHTRISMRDGFIPKVGKRGWIVDFEKSAETGGKETHHSCDGCGVFMHDIWHKCTVCEDFDYCRKCVIDAEETHNHPFEAMT
ncbi:hypothetical protein V492_06653 [Pseudogymnoascus sp. VKM F-4246]|nr:hypothetical protein V492_06653 [Pseudogymnoascus sp. VKM F-4246]